MEKLEINEWIFFENFIIASDVSLYSPLSIYINQEKNRVYTWDFFSYYSPNLIPAIATLAHSETWIILLEASDVLWDTALGLKTIADLAGTIL